MAFFQPRALHIVKRGEKLGSLEVLPIFGQPISRWSAPDLKASVKKEREGRVLVQGQGQAKPQLFCGGER